MSIRKRKWRTANGDVREAWIVDYRDGQGDRHIETFEKKKDADDYHATVKVDVRQGIHTAPNKSVTVAQAATDWLTHVEREGRERSTVAQYSQHVHSHINPRIGNEKLARLTAPRIEAFRDDLLSAISRPLARKVIVSLKSILRDAHRRGNVAQNVAAGVKITIDKRGRRKLQAGVDFPTPDEVSAIIHAASGKRRALIAVAVFAGLRASELRGLRWKDIDFAKAELHVRQRADRYSKIGKPKSHSGERTIPLGPFVVTTLKEWKLACPKNEGGLVFPTSRGRIDHHANILRALEPIMKAAGVMKAAGPDKDGKSVHVPKYALHAFRHFFASWCINRRKDGGLELPMKAVQERLGHSSIVMTSDVYGHLFPRGDDGGELADAEAALLRVH
jgi:integrase